MDAFATTVSVSLQYGVPLKDLVNKFAHVRFEPSGFTGNQEIPIAKSIIDYIFRWLGSRFLDTDAKVGLGLIDRSAVGSEAALGSPPASLSAFGASASPAGTPAPQPPAVASTEEAGPTSAPAADSRSDFDDQPKATAVMASEAAPASVPAKEELAVIATNGHANGHAAGGNGKANGNGGGGGTSAITMSLGATKVSFQTQADAPSCADCGSIMVRNGSCYKCLNCGSTSGCS